MATRTLTLTMSRNLILEAVKTDTYKTGQAEKQPDGSTSERVYNEQAGDDTFHERKLARTLRGSLGELESQLAEFADSSEGTIDDDLSENSDIFTITITVSPRFNGGMAKVVARIGQDFLINHMIYQWWLPTKPELAQVYLGRCVNCFSRIRVCLSKTAPAATQQGGVPVSYDTVTGEARYD